MNEPIVGIDKAKPKISIKEAAPAIQRIAAGTGINDVEQVEKLMSGFDADFDTPDDIINSVKYQQQQETEHAVQQQEQQAAALLSKHNQNIIKARMEAGAKGIPFVEPEMSAELKAIIASNQSGDDDTPAVITPAVAATASTTPIVLSEFKTEDFAGNEKALKLLQYASDLETNSKAELEKVNNFVVALKEYEKDPQSFVLKYLPEYIANLDSALHKVDYKGNEVLLPKEHFDKMLAANFIDDKGNTLIEIDPVKAGLPGTDDYKYTKLLQDGAGFVDKARNTRQSMVERVQNENKERQAQFETKLSETRTRFTKEYGQDAAFFDAKVLPHLKNLKAFDLMNFVNAVPEVIEMNVQKRVNEALKNKNISESFKSGQQPTTSAQAQFTSNKKRQGAAPKIFADLGEEW